MTVQIDDAFIRTWDPRYDETERDEDEYKEYVDRVDKEMRSSETISKQTLERIYRWKSERSVGRIDWERYDDLYVPAFRAATSAPPQLKLAHVFGLNGIRAPTGSTIIHFIYPESMPIIDQRTVAVLFAARRVGVLFAGGISATKQKALEQYEEFRAAINRIRCDCPGWSLRQIDRALFAFDKQCLSATRAPRGPSIPWCNAQS